MLITAVKNTDSKRLANFAYAAPEQRERGRTVDQRSDIYSLGLILNEMFTSQIPLGTEYKTINGVAPEFEYLDDLVADMIRQSPGDRPQYIEAIKNQISLRGKEFITRQKLSAYKQTVMPIQEIDDPIILDPPRLIEIDWSAGVLTLILNIPVNSKWIRALNTMGSYASPEGKEPGRFRFENNKAMIGATEREVQRIVDHFKSWLPKATAIYEQMIRQENKEQEERINRELKKHIEEEEARQRILSKVKI